jgi:hypothetical protein
MERRGSPHKKRAHSEKSRRLVLAPAAYAWRRLRSRPFSTLALTLALGGAGALIGWSSLTVALAQERNVRLQLGAVSPGARSLRVVYYTLPGEGDGRAPHVEAVLRGFQDVTAGSRRLQIWHSIERNNPLGTRLVIARESRDDVALSSGRLPAGCRGRVCEAVALRGGPEPGRRLDLGQGRTAVIVGRGVLREGLIADASLLGTRALLVRELGPPLEPLVANVGSTVAYTAPLDPERARGYRVPELAGELRREKVRLERGDPAVTVTAPVPLLDRLAERGRIARGRLLVVAGQAAALIAVFAAFVVSARRRETELVEQQLTTLGASRAQVWTTQIFEALVPSIGGLVVALAGLAAAIAAVARARGFPFAAFRSAALPTETIAAIVAVSVAAGLLLLVAHAPRRPSRVRTGRLELAALTGFGVLLWETWTTGALDPQRVGSEGPGPVLLLLPALTFFVSGVGLLRVLPLLLRVGERFARRGPFGLRLAVLTAARNPAQAAATTTFLAVALGSSLFSLDYRATLEQQARDQARFTAGARWRVVEHPDAAPLTRFARATAEPAVPVLRLDGDVAEAYPNAGQRRVTVLALPAARVPDLLGWRDGFSSLSRQAIARRLRPRPVRMTGPRVAPDATALRVWARAVTDFPRILALQLLLPGQHFAHVRLGVVGRSWELIRLPLEARLRGAQLVGIEFVPTYAPIDFKYDPKGFVDLGPIEQRRGTVWSRLPSLARWTATTAPDGTSGVVSASQFERGPVRNGIRFDLIGTRRPLIHPSFNLPDPLPGFENGAIPALAGGPVADEAVDGLLAVDVPGKRLPVRVTGRASLFPAIVDRPSSFIVLDYDTLFAALNADQPGLALPNEAWFFERQEPGFAARAARAAPGGVRVVGAEPLEAQLLHDPLASGARDVFGVAALIAALLGLTGLVLAVRSTLASERLLLAEYEALGVPPLSLRRAAQLRLSAMSALGIGAAALGAFVGARLITAFVAVTATATRPLPPIVTVVPWATLTVVVATVGVLGLGATALLAGRALRESAAKRLRA